jgi:hypothetical protein
MTQDAGCLRQNVVSQRPKQQSQEQEGSKLTKKKASRGSKINPGSNL